MAYLETSLHVINGFLNCLIKGTYERAKQFTSLVID